MNLLEEVADLIKEKVCDERRKYGSCNCISSGKKKKYNPCQRAWDLREQCLKNEASPELLEQCLRFVATRRCHKSKATQDCFHDSCFRAEKLQQLLEDQKKAA